MKQFNYITLFLISLILFCCDETEIDYTKKSKQELWLNGYTLFTSNGDKESDLIRFLFFDANNGETYITTTQETPNSSYYEYIHFQEDAIYSRLMDEGKIERSDGKIVSPVADHIDFYKNSKKQLEITLPVGKYFVIAVYFNRGYRRDYWNKYATCYYDLEARYNPQTLSVVIPADYNRIGCIPWIKWQDKSYVF